MCAKKKNNSNHKFQVGMQGDFEQESCEGVTMEFQEKGVELVVELPKVLANVFRWSSY